jgi:aminoglycoside phosphotransferase (APT) family kinase protein
MRLVLTAREYEVANRWMEQRQTDERMQEYDPVLVHGDLFYANLLVDEKTSRLIGVLDFENASIGDPAQDFAVQYSLGQPFYAAVVEAYTEAGGHLDESLEYRMHQYRILRSIYGLLFFAETGDLIEFANSVYKLRHSNLLRDVANC